MLVATISSARLRTPDSSGSSELWRRRSPARTGQAIVKSTSPEFCSPLAPARLPLNHRSDLESVFEARLALDRLHQRARVHLLVLQVKVGCHTAEDQQHDELQAHRDPKAEKVFWLIVLAERRGRQDAARGAEADLQGAGHDSLGLAADVVGVVGQDGGDIALAPGLAEEDAEVFHRVVLVVGRHHEAHDDHDALHCDERTPQTKFIPQVCKDKGTGDGGNHRRCSEEVGYSITVAKALQYRLEIVQVARIDKGFTNLDDVRREVKKCIASSKRWLESE
jgi:hypothetical protein